MIPSNAALVEEYWEPLLVLPLEQRRVAGREPPSERRSVEQPEYLGELLRHLRRHRAPITVTRPMGTATHRMDIPPIGIMLTDIQAMDIQPMDIQPTHSRAIDTQTIRVVPITSLPERMDTTAMLGTPIILARRATNTTAMRGTPLIPVPQAMDHQAT